jgi:hypothetical protein
MRTDYPNPLSAFEMLGASRRILESEAPHDLRVYHPQILVVR